MIVISVEVSCFDSQLVVSKSLNIVVFFLKVQFLNCLFFGVGLYRSPFAVFDCLKLRFSACYININLRFTRIYVELDVMTRQFKLFDLLFLNQCFCKLFYVIVAK